VERLSPTDKADREQLPPHLLAPKTREGNAGTSRCIHAIKITVSDRKGEVRELYRDLMMERNWLLQKTTMQAKRAIQTAKRGIENTLAAATAELTLRSTLSSSVPAPAASVTHSVKLPPIRLEPFPGDIETWARFSEQFEASIDQDPSLSTINKHVFLCGYLDGEPKLLVDGVAVLASTYEDTRRISSPGPRQCINMLVLTVTVEKCYPNISYLFLEFNLCYERGV
jgi:hypothetical protein